MKFVLEAKGLSKNYPEKQALKNLNLSPKQGEIFSLLANEHSALINLGKNPRDNSAPY